MYKNYSDYFDTLMAKTEIFQIKIQLEHKQT